MFIFPQYVQEFEPQIFAGYRPPQPRHGALVKSATVLLEEAKDLVLKKEMSLKKASYADGARERFERDLAAFDIRTRRARY